MVTIASLEGAIPKVLHLGQPVQKIISVLLAAMLPRKVCKVIPVYGDDPGKLFQETRYPGMDRFFIQFDGSLSLFSQGSCPCYIKPKSHNQTYGKHG